MSIRRAVVEVDLDGLNVTEFCRQHGISTWFFYDLRRRFAVEGEGALEPKSKAPGVVANRTPEWVEDRIIELRKELDDAGLDAGPGTIAFHLPGWLPEDVVAPSEATIWRVLSRRGFIVPDPKKAPKHSHRTFVAERANECWQIDDTEWALADGTPVKVINILDDCCRLAVGSRAAFSCTTEAALGAFMDAGEAWGLPARFLSDNAKAYRDGLAEAVAALGIGAGHSRPYHPQTCGKVERFHQTLKKWLAKQPRAETLEELQAQLDRFVAHYNHRRPHRSLGRRFPAQVFGATPKAGPADRALGTPTKVHRARVAPNGTLSAGSRYVISLGAAHAGALALVVVTGLACHVFVEGRLVRRLTLDPQRRVQPLHDRPGRPATVRDVPRHV